ncbi:PC-Esterase [Dillenia turbinata]|uniref:PC-Esterase n=1 Tax=Dillenia turbinata TaxID=194707 RepID=A0AAN8VSQ7_9MAGN
MESSGTWGWNQEERETLRLDMIQDSSSKYYDADIIIFNTGHWWTHQETTKRNFFQEGNHVYGRLKYAFRLQTLPRKDQTIATGFIGTVINKMWGIVG